MTNPRAVDKIFDYDSKKQILIDAKRNFDRYCELTKELYGSFIDKEELTKRKKHLEVIREFHLDKPIKTYERIIAANLKLDFDNENHIITHMFFLWNNHTNYSVLKKVLCSEYHYLNESKLALACKGLEGLLKKEDDEIKQEVKSKELHPSHHLLLEESNKLRELLYNQVSLLDNSNWKEYIETWVSFIPRGDQIFKSVEGSKHSVIEFMGDLIKLPNSFIMKIDKKGLNPFTFEKGIIDYINNNLLTKTGFDGDTLGYIPYYESKSAGHVRIHLPQVVYFSQCSFEDECLVLEKEEGNIGLTNDTSTPKQKKDCLNALVEFLSFIHAMMPPDVTQKGKIDTRDYIKSRLENKLLNLTESIKVKFYDNLAPILDCFSQDSYVFNKDAIPDNFVINKREGLTKTESYWITAIDWEDHGFQPLYFDLASLLEYSNYLGSDEKEDYLKGYIRFYNLHSWKRKLKKLEYNSNFKLSYLNAVVYRLICLTSAWSNPRREEFRPRRDYILNRAIECIKTIKEEHNDYYNRYKSNYDSLEEALKETIATLS